MSKANPAQLVQLCNAFIQSTLTPDEAGAAHQIDVGTVTNVAHVAKQVSAVSKYLELTYWSRLMACCLINGIVPPDLSLDDEKPIVAFNITDND